MKKIKKIFGGSALSWSLVAWGTPPLMDALHKYPICKFFTICSKKVR